MVSIILAIAILVPVIGTILYALFAGGKTDSQTSRRLTAFGEALEEATDRGF